MKVYTNSWVSQKWVKSNEHVEERKKEERRAKVSVNNSPGLICISVAKNINSIKLSLKSVMDKKRKSVENTQRQDLCHVKQGCKKSSTFLTPKFYDSNLPTFSGNTNPYFGSDTRVAWLGFSKRQRNMRR